MKSFFMIWAAFAGIAFAFQNCAEQKNPLNLGSTQGEQQNYYPPNPNEAATTPINFEPVVVYPTDPRASSLGDYFIIQTGFACAPFRTIQIRYTYRDRITVDEDGYSLWGSGCGDVVRRLDKASHEIVIAPDNLSLTYQGQTYFYLPANPYTY